MKPKLYLTKNFKKLREEQGTTQEDFVALMAVYMDKPVSLSQLQKMEQGKRPINPDMVLDFASYLKVSPKDIVERRT